MKSKRSVLLALPLLALISACTTPGATSSSEEASIVASSEETSLSESKEESSEETSLSERKEESSEESSSIESSEEESSSESSSVNVPIGPYIQENGYKIGSYSTRYYTDTYLIEQIDKDLDSVASKCVTVFSYKGLKNIFPYTDVDPNDSSKILSFYSGKSTTFASCNREHVWPNSRKGEATEKDPHVIRPTLTSENSARGNNYFGESTGWDPASFNNPKYRGIAARIIFYCAVRYQDSGLYLDDENNPSSTNDNQRPTMGKLSKLLEWNIKYPVDETEITRNSVLVNKYKWNCNPFILDPTLATTIWGHYNAACEAACGLA
ncbi:MAG: endonuclease [Bacilli bacterium]|nr:endonuclease [Bacilli bacterium]